MSIATDGAVPVHAGGIDLAELTAAFADKWAGCTDSYELRSAQFDAGLAWVHFPVGLGGLGLAREAQQLVDELLLERGIQPASLGDNPVGFGMAAPTLLQHGSAELKHRLIRRIFTGEDIWCQMFSEPSNGSDVAGVSTQARRVEGGWLVTGQKVWTSYAHLARYGLLLARTDPRVPKHRGLSYFIADMQASGVEVRPLMMMTGDTTFNEVFLDEMFIAEEYLLGDEGDGWRVAMSTLMNERVAIGGGQAHIAQPLIDDWRARPPEVDAQSLATLREVLTRLWIEAEAARLTAMRASRTAAGALAGPEGAIGKLWAAELMQRAYALRMEMALGSPVLLPEGYPLERHDSAHQAFAGSPGKSYLRSRALTIEGGTSEVMRNILGERVLGLPGEPRIDRDVPWNEVPRS
jgi:alkylation response protein AidB-like acyl-CoA dehydrogenase